MKKILFYTDTPQIGGAENIMLLLAKFLNKEKFEAILVCSAYKKLDKWCAQFQKEQIKVYRLNVIHKHDPRHFTQLKKIIKKEKPQLLHIHVWNPASCRYAFYASGKLPVITTEHDPFPLPRIKNLFKKATLKRIDRIIAISEENKKLLQTLYPVAKEKITLIHNGIDPIWWRSQLMRFNLDERKKIKEEIFFAKEDTLIVICVAELHARKGQRYIINAIPDIIKDYQNTKFVFVGDGPAHEKYKSLVKQLKIEKNCVFTGKKPKSKIPLLMKCSDIFILPSIREAFGLVNVEAMLTSLPVIASKVGGIPEIVLNNKTGILVEAKNSEKIKTALIKLISNREIREKMGNAGYKRAKEKFSAKIMTENYEKIYEELC